MITYKMPPKDNLLRLPIGWGEGGVRGLAWVYLTPLAESASRPPNQRR